MDDLLVVIISLIIAGAGALGQLKKKKQVTQNTAGEINSQNDIWDLFNADRFMSPISDDSDEAKEVFVKEPGPAVNEQNYTFVPKNEGGKIFESTLAKPAAANQRKSVFKNKFSARDAVIYSEILNRKYF